MAVALAFGLVISIACSSGQQAASAEQTEQPSATLEGKLTHLPLPKTKSMRAYLGHEFFLMVAGKQASKEVLQPSPAVSREQLLKLKDQRVRVVGIHVPGTRPDPDARSSYPTDHDGRPLPQGGGLQVLSIEVLK